MVEAAAESLDALFDQFEKDLDKTRTQLGKLRDPVRRHCGHEGKAAAK